MKSTLFSLAVFLVYTSYGQSTKNEKLDITVSFGVYSHLFFNEAKVNNLPGFDIPMFSESPIDGSGIINAELRRKVKDKFQAGISLSYQNIHVNDGLYGIKYKVSSIAIMPSFYYNYKTWGLRHLYSGISLGVGLLNYKSEYGGGNKNKFAYQATALGIRAGNKVAVVTEFGYGYKGVLQFGLSLQL